MAAAASSSSSSSLVLVPLSCPLYRRASPPSTTSCVCVASFALRGPLLRANAAVSLLEKYQHGPLLGSVGGGRSRRRVSGTRRLVTFASPSAKYIREDYLVKKVSAKEVGQLVKGERSVPLVVDFYATWCGPCILMAQQLEMLAVEYENNVLFVKVDTDDEYEFARDMQVRGLPTLYFISPDPSKDAIRTEGLIPPEMIKNIIDNEM